MAGWISLYRSIQEHWLWKDAEMLRAWLDLLLLANYEDKKTLLNGELVICRRGDVNLSITCLAKRWEWSRPRVTRFLEKLERDGMITTDVTTHRTVITIVKYDFFQCYDTQTLQPTLQPTLQQTLQPTCTTNNINKFNKLNNKKSKQNQFNKFEGRQDYNFEEIEKRLLK